MEEEKKEEWVVTVRFFRLMEQEGGAVQQKHQ